ncbi:hypothetical protein B0F90DRAFT_24804 [Multifurca ochricompacta]|uniref:Uncharacterized protein n=1 Tax=Multifurca ochricompacta TaxID=376703 RepID=A0AAD4MCG9_9AGAM|nr:hypothetical protein B0F90DRAFT_24804 [Multifurca ochricompacta]
MRLLKDATRDPPSNPVLDLRYWKLLHGIILSVTSESPKMGTISNDWLRPLLNRVPLLPIVLSLLSNFLNLPTQKQDELCSHSSRSLALVWSLATPKFTPDALLECFGAALQVLEGTVESSESSGMIEICRLVTSSLQTILSNSLTKKFSQVFITSHLCAWLNVTHKARAPFSPARAEICDVGAQLLFKQMADDPRDSPLFGALQTHIHSSPHDLHSTLPVLMTAFINAMKKRRPLHSLGSSPAVDVASLGIYFFSSCEEILRGVPDAQKTQVWHSRLNLLKIVETESLFSPGNESTAVLLKQEVDVCVECLTSPNHENVRTAIQCLCLLSRIDHDLVEDSTSRILAKFPIIFQWRGGPLDAPVHELLSLALSYHTRTRTLPAHISRLLMDSCTIPPFLPPSSMRISYDSLVASPVFTRDHLNKLSKAVRTFITPGQTLDTARRVIVMLRDTWRRFWDAEKAVATDCEMEARKKRRTSESSKRAKEA